VRKKIKIFFAMWRGRATAAAAHFSSAAAGHGTRHDSLRSSGLAAYLHGKSRLAALR
jgi:hypothetical protein